MKRLTRLVALVLALLCVPAAAHAGRCEDARFRAMTYNIRLDTPADGPNRWELRRDLLLGQVRLVRPAVLGLQEVTPGQRADLVAALDGYAVLGGGRDDGKDAGEASPLLVDKARFRIGAHGMFWLSPTPLVPSRGWDAAYPRIATWARLVDRGSGHRLLAINTHWDHVGETARAGSADLLREWIARHRGPGESVVLMGDFNAVLEEGSMQALLAPQQGFAGLRDARSASREPALGGPATFNGWDLAAHAGGAIDHVLVGPDLVVLRYHVLAAHFGGRLASDHFAVIADLAPAACVSAAKHGERFQ